MKNRTVERMVRSQFDVPDHIDVVVNCVGYFEQMYSFVVTWWRDDTRYECKTKLPRLEATVTDYTQV